MGSGPVGFICTICGHRQPAAGECGGCGDDCPLDLAKAETIEFLRQIEQHAIDRREGRVRGFSVVAGITIIILLLTQGWWWELRMATMALPFFLDQIILMTLIAMGTMALLGKVWPVKRRFPVLDEL